MPQRHPAFAIASVGGEDTKKGTKNILLVSFFSFLYMMIIRIVRMYFREDTVKEFLEIFDKNKEKIRNFPGCNHLQLLKDSDDSLCYTTYSHWNSPDDLENYRNSELFGTVWKPVKKLFSKKSEAFSLEKFIEL